MARKGRKGQQGKDCEVRTARKGPTSIEGATSSYICKVGTDLCSSNIILIIVISYIINYCTI